MIRMETRGYERLDHANKKQEPSTTPSRVPGATQQSAQAALHKAGACRMPAASDQVDLVLAPLEAPLAAHRDQNMNNVGLEPLVLHSTQRHRKVWSPSGGGAISMSPWAFA